MHRFIVATARVTVLLSVLVSPLIGAGLTLFYPWFPFVGTLGSIVFGAIVGFALSCVGASILFTLIEIAQNTRRSLEILKGGQGGDSAKPRFAFQSGEQLSEAARDVIQLARKKGYGVNARPNGSIEISGSGIETVSYLSNEDVVQFGKWLRG